MRNYHLIIIIPDITTTTTKTPKKIKNSKKATIAFKNLSQVKFINHAENDCLLFFPKQCLRPFFSTLKFTEQIKRKKWFICLCAIVYKFRLFDMILEVPTIIYHEVSCYLTRNVLAKHRSKMSERCEKCSNYVENNWYGNLEVRVIFVAACHRRRRRPFIAPWDRADVSSFRSTSFLCCVFF